MCEGMGKSGPSPPLRQVAVPPAACPSQSRINETAVDPLGFSLSQKLHPAADRRDGPPPVASDWGKVPCSGPSPSLALLAPPLLVGLSGGQAIEDPAPWF